MNTQIKDILLKMGAGIQNMFKTQTPLELLNQERIALGYEPLSQSEWLAVSSGRANIADSEKESVPGFYLNAADAICDGALFKVGGGDDGPGFYI